MRRLLPFAAGLLGLVLLALMLPSFDIEEPAGLRVSRVKAREIADREARQLGVPVESSWPLVIWEENPLLGKELTPDSRQLKAARVDPVVSPRLEYYRVAYFRYNAEKRPEYADVIVGRNGDVLGARRLAKPEETGTKPNAADLRPLADAWVASHPIPGVVKPVFDSVRPRVLNSRTEHTFRYRVATPLAPKLAFYVEVYYIGDVFAGWDLVEEYADGSSFRYDMGEEMAAAFGRYVVMFVLLLVLLFVFLRKYHAGEVGVGTGSLLFAIAVALGFLLNFLTTPESSWGFQAGGMEARVTAVAYGAFRFLFSDIPLAILLFLGWSVGESFARERWGEKLASFDAILRRDPVNRTVGHAVLCGLLYAPVVAAAALLPGWIAVQAGMAWPAVAPGTLLFLGSSGGSLSVIISAAIDALIIPVMGFLLVLAVAHRKRMLLAGFVVAAILGTALGGLQPPIQPLLQQLTLGFGGIAAGALVFLAGDLLSSTVAIFVATLALGFLPLMRVAAAPVSTELMVALLVPVGLLALFAAAGLATKRLIVYEAMDLAPHVRRIVERERVKAEIDAANRIQAALLPADAPEIGGAAIASHYRSATEIGGDYFDFLPLPGGRIGLAFGDVAGHGLTSGIVMAMAKSALLVQVGYDATPQRVMEVLNDIVLKTAPKRMLMTFFFGLLEPESNELVFSSAGHLDPYVYRAGEGRLEPLSVWGFPLGVRRREPFREMSVRFEPGDRLILYSDGLIEAVDDDGHPFGFERFEEVLQQSGDRSADEIKKAVLNAVKRFTRNRPPEDDQTLVVVSFEGVERLTRTA